MIVVIFEVQPKPGRTGAYLALAEALRPLLDGVDGFISIERFASLTNPAKILSLSFWRDEAAVAEWRRVEAHRDAQSEGRAEIFDGYRMRIAGAIRDYGMKERQQAPPDSQAFHRPLTADRP